jgi:hypothetical protein
MPLAHGKKRPLVDPSVFNLARDWITENYAINADTADAASDCLDDAIWDLADAVQREIENWLNDAEGSERLRLVARDGTMTLDADRGAPRKDEMQTDDPDDVGAVAPRQENP